MAPPVLPAARPCGVTPPPQPPRGTFPVAGPRVRASAGLLALVGLAMALGVTVPAREVAWAPFVALVTVVLSTLVHEGAHAWAAHNLGYRVDWVMLGGLTGATAWSGRDDRPLDRAAVALAGPAASAALVLGLLAVRAALGADDAVAGVVELAVAVNVVALVTDLVPFGPTDGAHLIDGLHRHARRT